MQGLVFKSSSIITSCIHYKDWDRNDHTNCSLFAFLLFALAANEWLCKWSPTLCFFFKVCSRWDQQKYDAWSNTDLDATKLWHSVWMMCDVPIEICWAHAVRWNDMLTWLNPLPLASSVYCHSHSDLPDLGTGPNVIGCFNCSTFNGLMDHHQMRKMWYDNMQFWVLKHFKIKIFG